jgi:2,4-dienoyl-CoA reductase-like NADH-dependent reductase (Old Yellow Enzyme family)
MSRLFERCHVGPLPLKNRFVRSATGEARADRNGLCREEIFPIYEALARGGVGLIVTGHMYVLEDQKCSPRQTGIWSDRHMPGLERLARACRGNGTRAVAQLNAAARRPGTLSAADLGEVVDGFVAAALRAERAGFDGVQLHAAHGYLLSAFLTPAENDRADAYGGDAVRRRNLLLEVVEQARGALAPQTALLCKLGVVDGRDDSLPLEEAVETARALEEAGVDAIEVSCTFGGPRAMPSAEGIDAPEKEAYFAPEARAVRAAVGVPVILVGGLRSLDVMERLVEEGACDMVSLCRPLIRRPDLVNAFGEGRTRRADCVSCNKCYDRRGFRCVFAAGDAE